MKNHYSAMECYYLRRRVEFLTEMSEIADRYDPIDRDIDEVREMQRLERLYRDVCDFDPFIAGLSSIYDDARASDEPRYPNADI